ncbi:hypothetical protein SLA2020_447800 [Shorea laevis]
MRWEVQQALIIERMERIEKKIEMLYAKKYGVPYPQHSQTVSTPFPESILTVTQKPKDTKAQPPPDFSGVTNLASHRRSQHLLVSPTPNNRRQQQGNMPHHRHRLHQSAPPTDQTTAPPPPAADLRCFATAVHHRPISAMPPRNSPMPPSSSSHTRSWLTQMRRKRCFIVAWFRKRKRKKKVLGLLRR